MPVPPEKADKMALPINQKVFEQFPELETPRLRLRAFTSGDAAILLRLRSHPKIMKYMDAYPLKSREEALEMIQNNQKEFKATKMIDWILEEKASGTVLGYTGFYQIDQRHRRVEIAYVLDPDFWGKGYMYEAAGRAIAFAFHDLQAHSICANVNIANTASMHLLDKLGFRREAHFRENYFFDGNFLDSYIYGLLAGDLPPDIKALLT